MGAMQNDKDRWRKATWTKRTRKVMKDIAFALLPQEETALINQQAASLRRVGEAGERLYVQLEKGGSTHEVLVDHASTLEMLALFGQAFQRRYPDTNPYIPSTHDVWDTSEDIPHWNKHTLKKREEIAGWIGRLL